MLERCFVFVYIDDHQHQTRHFEKKASFFSRKTSRKFIDFVLPAAAMHEPWQGI